MTKQHADNKIIAEGTVMPLHPEEQGQSVTPQRTSLYLDTDAMYRWYEEGSATEAAGESLRTAVESARLKWPQFQLVSLRGQILDRSDEAEIPNDYAADELPKS